jgi:hypothetical protein
LLEQKLTLGLTGTGPVELGLSFEPALGAPRQPSAFGFLRYSLRCADLKDGGFALRLGLSASGQPVAGQRDVAGEGEQVWKLLTSTSVQQVLEWEQELVEQVKVVSSVSGQGIAGVLVTWRNEDLGTTTRLTDFYGVATVRFKPQTPGPAVVTATVGETAHAESVELPGIRLKNRASSANCTNRKILVCHPMRTARKPLPEWCRHAPVCRWRGAGALGFCRQCLDAVGDG